jgi:2-oxoglutarate dehydrogenase E1 component
MNASRLQDRADQLIRAYRVRGHLAANIDPLGFERHPPAELAPEFYHLSEADLERPVSTMSIGGPATQKLSSIIAVYAHR